MQPVPLEHTHLPIRGRRSSEAISMQPVPLEHAHLPIRGRRSSEAISMQSVPLEHAHLPIALGSPLEPAQLDVPVDGQRNQSAVLSTT